MNTVLIIDDDDQLRRSFEKLLAGEAAPAIAPDLAPEELLSALKALYPPEKEALGVVALEIEPEPAG